jgi:thymidine phosphorylase
LDCEQVGWAVQRSGAGRTTAGEAVAANAGVATHKKLGDPVAAGETVFTVYAEQEERLGPAAAILARCFTVGAQPPHLSPLIENVIA